jgi:hypothetical protein
MIHPMPKIVTRMNNQTILILIWKCKNCIAQ